MAAPVLGKLDSWGIIRVALTGILALGLFTDQNSLRDLALAALGMFIIYRAATARERIVRPVPLELPIILFGCAILLSLLTAVDLAYSANEFRSEFIRNVGLLYIAINCVRSERETKIIYALLLALGVAAMLYGIIDFFMRDGSLTAFMPYRARSFFDDFQYFGAFLTLIAPLFLLLPLWRRSLAPWVIFLFAPLIGFSAYITYARWVWIVFFLELNISLLLWLRKKWIVLVVILAAIVVSLFMPGHIWRHALSSERVKSSTEARLMLYKFSFEKVADHPFRGIGFGRDSFKRAYADFVREHIKTMWHAHNTYVNILLQLGIQGLAAFLFLWYRIMKTWWPGKTSGEEDPFIRYVRLTAFVMIGGFFLRNMGDDLFVDTPLNIFWLMLGLSFPLLSYARERREVLAGPK